MTGVAPLCSHPGPRRFRSDGQNHHPHMNAPRCLPCAPGGVAGAPPAALESEALALNATAAAVGAATAAWRRARGVAEPPPPLPPAPPAPPTPPMPPPPVGRYHAARRVGAPSLQTLGLDEGGTGIGSVKVLWVITIKGYEGL